MTLKLDGSHAQYTLTHHGNCVLVEGTVPISALDALIKLVPDGSVMGIDLARKAGVTMTFGPKDEINALSEAFADKARARVASMPGVEVLSPCAQEWLANGERGVSSNTMLTVLTGFDALEGSRESHPYDLSDFRRCRLLLDRCPELAANLQKMKDVSPEWAELVKSWPELCELMDLEAPKWRTNNNLSGANKTKKVLQALLALCVDNRGEQPAHPSSR